MMKTASWFVLAAVLTGCQTMPSGDWSRVVKPEEQAQHLMAAGELYRARKIANHLVQENPANSEAQMLMAEIIDKEIARQKDVLEPVKAVEEFDDRERNAEIQTWLERGRGYLALKQYEQAFLAAEKVFLYDATNKEASSLIDDIRAEAVREGKQGFGVQDRVIREEIQERIYRYQEQAEKSIEKERWGTARLAAEKMLLLEPNNPYALKVQERIRTLRKTTLT